MSAMKQTQLDTFIIMLESAGHKYSVINSPMHWLLNGYGRRKIMTTDSYTLIIVEGHFYDDLSAYFDSNGDLIEMLSHVVVGHPGSDRAKKIASTIQE